MTPFLQNKVRRSQLIMAELIIPIEPQITMLLLKLTASLQFGAEPPVVSPQTAAGAARNIMKNPAWWTEPHGRWLTGKPLLPPPHSRTCCALSPPPVPQSTQRTWWRSRSSQRTLAWRAEASRCPTASAHSKKKTARYSYRRPPPTSFPDPPTPTAVPFYRLESLPSALVHHLSWILERLGLFFSQPTQF